MLRKPAVCGLFSGNFRAQNIIRNHWPRLTVPYNTYGLSVETRAPFCGGGDLENFWTIGGQLTFDQAGDSRLTRWQGQVAIGRHQTLSYDRGDALIVSFIPGFVNSHFDPTHLRWDDQYVNGSYNPGMTNQVLKTSNITYGELGAGIVYTSPISEDASFYVGGSLYHLLLFSLSNSSSSFNINSDVTSKPNAKWLLNGGMEMRVNQQRVNIFGDYIRQGAFKPTKSDTTTAIKAGKYSTFLAGAMITFNPKSGETSDEDKTSISFGATYRWDDAIAPLVRLEHHQFNFGLSYDINISRLTVASKGVGGFELTMGYKLNNCSPNSGKCPHF